jgi:hypothetical protein
MSDTTHPLTDHYHLTVDYGQSLEQMIAAGRYDWANSDITAQRFSITGEGTTPVEARLFHFERYLSSSDAVAAITADDLENPWEPAQIEHLLSFGAAHPEEQRRYPIVALGSVAEIRGHRFVPGLYGSGVECDLYLPSWFSDWGDRYRFLAVRNLPSGA